MKTLLTTIALSTLLFAASSFADVNETTAANTAEASSAIINTDLTLSWALDSIDLTSPQTALIFDFSETDAVASLGR